MPRDGRDLGQRHPEEVVQRDDRSVRRIETPERRVHQLAVGERARDVGLRGGIDGGELDLDRSPSPAPGDVETGVDGQSMEPGVEPLGIAKSRQVAPGADERLLDGVARELRVPEDQASRRVQPREPGIDELGEGVMIALPRAFDVPQEARGGGKKKKKKKKKTAPRQARSATVGAETSAARAGRDTFSPRPR